MIQQIDLNAFAEEKARLCEKTDRIPPMLFQEYGVNRGLRDAQGAGVLTGLTRISKVNGFKTVNGERLPCEGELWYRGYPIHQLVQESGTSSYGFEKAAYLLLFGQMPAESEMEAFLQILSGARDLPEGFTRDVIMEAPSGDIMNSITRSILTLASYDPQATKSSVANSLRQCIQLTAQFPMLAVYSYHAYNHYQNHDSMYIHRPDPNRSTAENFLAMLRPDQSYSELEAKVLDICLMLHMEHGGGNNSTFTTRVVTSAGSDTYSAIAAAMSSLKGPKHGGANLKVMGMMDDIKAHVRDWNDQDEVRAYLQRLISGEGFDNSGLIYGMGHAIYTLSDPREKILKDFVKRLAAEKGNEELLALYENVEAAAPEVIAAGSSRTRAVSPNVDFYSGFVYEMLGIPRELFTPLFATARIVGWSAHRIEELITSSKIIRPAYMSVMEERQ